MIILSVRETLLFRNMSTEIVMKTEISPSISAELTFYKFNKNEELAVV